MNKSPYRSAAGSDPGRIRGNNEDRVYNDDERGIYLVIDGVGGEAGGERAAAIAEKELLARLERATGTVEDRIREGIALGGKRIYEQAQRNPELAGMACVLTLAVVTDEEAIVGHVGDTRMYKIRRGAIEKVTPDHSPVGAREDAGEISEMEAMHHPRRNEIFRDVGSGERRPDDAEFIDIRKVHFEPDSALLLCSDGLTDQVPSGEIRQIVEDNAGDPGNAVRTLIRRANDAGGKDNVSVVCVEGPEFAAPRAGSPAATHAGLRTPATVLGGMLLGALATLGILYFAGSLANQPQKRILTVAQNDKDAFGSIEAALASARAGDTIEVLPGNYREQVILKEGVHLVSRPPGQAVIQPRPDATAAGAAIIIEKARSGSLAGFRIAGGERDALSVGVLVSDSDVDLEDVEIDGATSGGILVRGTSKPAIRASYIHNNYGAGVRVEDSAAPRFTANLIVNNGSPGQPRSGVEVAAGAQPAFAANVIANNLRNLSWQNSPEREAEVRKQNLVVEQAPPKPRERRK